MGCVVAVRLAALGIPCVRFADPLLISPCEGEGMGCFAKGMYWISNPRLCRIRR